MRQQHTQHPQPKPLRAAALVALAGAALAVVSTGCSSVGHRDPAVSLGNGAPRPVALHVSEGQPMLASTGNGNAAAPMFAPAPAANVGADGMIRGSLAYPTGDPKTSAIVLEKAVPAEVLTNKPYSYELTVHNVSANKLDNVEVTESLPAGLKLADKVEGAVDFSVADNVSHLKVGTLQAGEKKTFLVGATATAQGAVTNSASVTYDSSLTLATAVVSPALTMTKTLPSDVLICDHVPLKISLCNTGTGTARNVHLNDMLPAGMTTIDGKSSFALDLGNIGSGETKNIELPLKLANVGAYKNTATATADDGLHAEASATVSAHQAILELTKSGPRQQYVGVPYTYDITLTNKGDADATNVIVNDTLPAGLIATAATENGKIENGHVSWTIAKLAMGESRPIRLTVKGVDTGTAHNTVNATADCATPAIVSADTALVGIASLKVEVMDDPDPIAVGGQTTYNITITNGGTAPATNVRLAGDLEPQMEYVGAQGTTAVHPNGLHLSFDPLATLAPKAKATYSVTVTAKDAGDVRFKATLTSDQTARPVEELESSTFFK